MKQVYFYENLPEKLSLDREKELFISMQNGSKSARDELIVHNMRFVVLVVMKYFQSVEYDKADLVSIGRNGLERAIDSYDVNKGVSFSAFATKCIYNEIAVFLRKYRKDSYVDSLDRIIQSQYYDSTVITLGDTICDKKDFTLEYEEKEVLRIIYSLINDFPERDKLAITLLFGLFGNRRYKQHEVAKIIGVDQSNVSLIKKRIITQIRANLQQCGIITPTQDDCIKTKKARKRH